MSRFIRILKNILLWTYGRGTWQYDLMCALILGFIFLTPPAFFKENRKFHPKQLPAAASFPAPAPEGKSAVAPSPGTEQGPRIQTQE